MVQSLTDAGNVSVFGLIDWDRKNTGTPRICVLGGGERYAIENYLLDPLLVAAALLNEDPESTRELGLNEGATYASFSSLSTAELSAASMVVQERILGCESKFKDRDASLKGSLAVTYRGGWSMDLAHSYLHANGHDLEEAVLQVFPKLRRYQGAGKLLGHMANVVARNHPLLIPSGLEEAFRWLCEAVVDG